ncbi:MAG: winged helix-turn-helix domain-containing protein [Thermoanaerobaculia bacterium]
MHVHSESEIESLAGIAALIGDPTRAALLTALMADRALSATELAAIAHVAKPTISSHLEKLRVAGLISVEPQGRYKYFRLAGPEVAATLEAILGLAFRSPPAPPRRLPADPELRKARRCYDHLAGTVGVRVHEQLLESGALLREGNGRSLQLTERGERIFAGFGIDLAAIRDSRRPLCRSCLDWTERRHHLAGAIGAALLNQVIARRWARLDRTSRALHFSTLGEAALFGALSPMGEDAYEASSS